MSNIAREAGELLQTESRVINNKGQIIEVIKKVITPETLKAVRLRNLTDFYCININPSNLFPGINGYPNLKGHRNGSQALSGLNTLFMSEQTPGHSHRCLTNRSTGTVALQLALLT